MPRKPKPKPQPEPVKSYDEFADEGEVIDEEVANVEPEVPPINTKQRDWRDVEKLKEARLLRKLVDDDLDSLLDERPRRR